MSHHCQNASVPQHIYGQVRSEILYGLDQEKVGEAEECVIFGVTSIPSRALHFSILCESGAQWARIPIHMLRHRTPEDGAKLHPMENLQMWDCHGIDFSVTQYEYLREMGCKYRLKDGSMVDASYWFTLDHTDNGFSLYPPEHKCYHLLLLEDGSGQIAAMPNNRIVWKDFSFVKPREKFDYRVMHETTWHAEEGRRNPQETAHTQEKTEETSATSRYIKPPRWVKRFEEAGIEMVDDEAMMIGTPDYAEMKDVGPGESPIKKALEELSAIEKIASIKCFKGRWDNFFFMKSDREGMYICEGASHIEASTWTVNELQKYSESVPLTDAIEATKLYPAASELHQWLKETFRESQEPRGSCSSEDLGMYRG